MECSVLPGCQLAETGPEFPGVCSASVLRLIDDTIDGKDFKSPLDVFWCNCSHRSMAKTGPEFMASTTSVINWQYLRKPQEMIMAVLSSILPETIMLLCLC